MIESQVPYNYDGAALSALRKSLSEPRMTKYLLRADGDEAYAIALYLYNTRLAQAFLFPIAVTEVVFRNAVDETLIGEFGENWYEDGEFRDQILTEKSLTALDRVIDRVGIDYRGKVISGLTFDFWSNLFREDYDEFWEEHVSATFPVLSTDDEWKEIRELAIQINRFRNRVAHHEPIIGHDANMYLSRMYRLTRLRCPRTADWMRHHTVVGTVLRSRPNRQGCAPVSLLDKLDRKFHLVDRDTRLMDIASAEVVISQAFVCVDGKGAVVGAFTHQQYSQFISEKALETGGIIDFNDHTVAAVLKYEGVEQGCAVLPSRTPFLDVVNALKEPRVRLVVATNEDTHEPLGVILRAHRRY